MIVKKADAQDVRSGGWGAWVVVWVSQENG